MKHSILLLLLVAILPSGSAAASGTTEETSTFARVQAPYETIRRALLADTLEGVAVAATRIDDELDALGDDPGSDAAGIRDGSGDELREILPSLRGAVGELRTAAELTDARDAFGALSRAMVRYRALVPDPEFVVVYCSMAEAVWLQPRGEIGNPYYGQSMARCGEIVSE